MSAPLDADHGAFVGTAEDIAVLAVTGEVTAEDYVLAVCPWEEFIGHEKAVLNLRTFLTKNEWKACVCTDFNFSVQHGDWMEQRGLCNWPIPGNPNPERPS